MFCCFVSFPECKLVVGFWVRVMLETKQPAQPKSSNGAAEIASIHPHVVLLLGLNKWKQLLCYALAK